MTWIKELSILRNFFRFCVNRKWMSSNPAKEVKPPTVKHKPKEPYTQEEVLQILSACDELVRGPYECDRARTMVLLLRYTGLRISDVATLARDRVREDRIYLYTMKNGKPVSKEALPRSSCDTMRNGLFSGRNAFRAWLKTCGMSDFCQVRKKWL